MPPDGFPLYFYFLFTRLLEKEYNCLDILPNAWTLAREPGELRFSIITDYSSRESLSTESPSFPEANRWEEGLLFCTVILTTLRERRLVCYAAESE